MLARREDGLTERERLIARCEARRALMVRQAEHDLRTFIKLHQPSYREPTHMARLVDALDRSMHGPVFIVLEAPPRHFKTSVLMAHMARLLRYRQGASVAYATYANDIAFRRSRNVRELAATAGVWVGEEQRTRQRFDPSKSVAFWQTLQGGQFVAGGRRGQFIGEGFTFICYDDPIKDAQESMSKVARDEAFTTLQGTLMNRLEPGASVVVAHQRWNDDDPIARIKDWIAKDPDAPPFEVITLRAIENIEVVEDAHGNERIVGGEPLCPWRYDLADLIRLASSTQDFFWPQYQQDVTPRGKKLFPELERFDAPRTEHAVLLISCDPGIDGQEAAERKKKKPDPAGIVVAWVYMATDLDGEPDIGVDVIWAAELWLESIDLLNYLEELQTVSFPGAPVLLEEVSAFRILEQVARRMNKALDLIAVVPRGSKLLRSLPTAKGARHRIVRCARHGKWVAGFTREVRDFTGKPGRRDNRVDALTQLRDHAEYVLGMQSAGAEAGGATILQHSPY